MMLPETMIDRRTYTQNRELSWLKFNKRVLEEAEDPSVPLLERLKFVSIFQSNLDEFFMIRVGSLFDLSLFESDSCDNKSGMTPREQLNAVYAAVRPLYAEKDKLFRETEKGLREYGVSLLEYHELEENEVKFVKKYYKTNIRPILSPQIVDTHHPFPHFLNKGIYIVAQLIGKTNTIFGLIPIPSALPEILPLPGSDLRYITIERVIYEFAEDAFGGKYEIEEKNCLCITRNADLSVDDELFESSDDFKNRMKKLLHERKKLSAVRMEVNYPLSEKFADYLSNKFHLEKEQIFLSEAPLKMTYVFGLFEKLNSAQKKQIVYTDFKPQLSASLDSSESILKQVKKKDVLLHYPYESMDSFLQLLKEVVNDPGVISIKITIYRLAKKAKLVDYLCAAAENGKDVTVLMELRARFDEQNNIDWSEKLEDAGCRIIYGFEEYKVHSKICLVTMKEKNGVSYITQVGTGNYNEKTAELYTDLSLITANPTIGKDAAEFFKNMAIGNLDGSYKSLLVAPFGFKSNLLYLMEEEIAKGESGSIFIKINSITDVDIIDKLVEASKAGVDVKLIVRGICCILPKIPGETDHITVTSIVGRFLEHSRIYSFGEGEAQKIYIASADLMTRNTARRVEVACPIFDKQLKYRINRILEAHWYDNVKARILDRYGNYLKKVDNRNPVDCQEYFLKEAQENSIETKRNYSLNIIEKLQKWVSGMNVFRT